MIVYKTPSSSKDITAQQQEDTTVYVVKVDSRGRSHHVSDLDCYKEQTCGAKFFDRSIANNNTSEYTCVQSIVAELCGLNLKLYFKESMNDDDSNSQPSDEEDNNDDDGNGLETQHHIHDHSLYKRHHCLEHELIKDHNNGKHHGGYKINAIATALTFNPYTGYYGHIIKNSEAYVVLDDGKSELSKRQVWGLLEFIREVKSEYHHLASNGSNVGGDNGGGHYSDEAKLILFKKAKEYRDGHWVPHSIYEPRHTHNHHIHQHQHHDEEPPKKSEDPKKPQADEPPYPLHHHRGHKVQYERLDSGRSDQATCHHGHSHIHHIGHHECCHDSVYKYHPSNNTDDGHYQQHHIVVKTKSKDDDNDNDDIIVHQKHKAGSTTTTGFGRIIMNLSDELLCHSRD